MSLQKDCLLHLPSFFININRKVTWSNQELKTPSWNQLRTLLKANSCSSQAGQSIPSFPLVRLPRKEINSKDRDDIIKSSAPNIMQKLELRQLIGGFWKVLNYVYMCGGMWVWTHKRLLDPLEMKVKAVVRAIQCGCWQPNLTSARAASVLKNLSRAIVEDFSLISL